MGVLTDEQRKMIDDLFRMTDFRSMYEVIHQTYRSLELGLDLEDSDRIAEYTYITQQLRKFMSAHYDPIIKCGSNLPSMLMVIESWLDKNSEYGQERKQLVYNFLRDQWITELYNGIQYLINEAGDEEEVE